MLENADSDFLCASASLIDRVAQVLAAEGDLDPEDGPGTLRTGAELDGVHGCETPR